MKILWVLRRFPSLGVQFESEFIRALEKIIGKENIVFYGLKNLPKTDLFGNKHFPDEYKFIDGMSLSQMLKEENPDVIVLQDKPISTGIDDMKGSNVLRILFLEDAHYEWHDVAVPYLDRKEIDMIFVRGYGNGEAFRVKQRCPVGYSPYSIPINMFYDKGLQRIHDFYFTGTTPVIYPLRVLMSYTFFGPVGGFVSSCFSRTFNYNNMKGIADGRLFKHEEYLNTLNQSKLAVFDVGMFKYPVMKFFEAMACGALVLSELPYDYKALRFEPNENMIEINFENFGQKIEEYVKNESERKRIIKNSIDLIMKYHTTEERAKQFLAQLEEAVAAKKEGRTFDYRNVKGEAGRMLSILEQEASNFNKDNLFNKCMENGLHPAYDIWHEEAYIIWRDIVAGRATVQKWIDFVKANQ